MKKLILAAIVLFSGNVMASTITGVPGEIFIGPQSTLIGFKIVGNSNLAACASQDLFVFDSATDGGKNIYAAVLAAKAAAAPIIVQGTNTCNLFAGAETVSLVTVK